MVDWLIRNQNQDDSWSISVIFVDDEYIQSLNKKFLGKDQPTDVLSFNLSDAAQNNFEGELYISLQTAKRQADNYALTFKNEVMRLVAHGVLHLFGYEDETDSQRDAMKLIENQAIQSCF